MTEWHKREELEQCFKMVQGHLRNKNELDVGAKPSQATSGTVRAFHFMRRTE